MQRERVEKINKDMISELLYSNVNKKFPINKIKKDLECIFGEVEDLNRMLIISHIKQGFHITLTYDGNLMLVYDKIIRISNEEKHDIVNRVERVLQKYSSKFMFITPFNTVENRILRVLEKHKKISGTVEKPFMSDRQLVAEIIREVNR